MTAEEGRRGKRREEGGGASRNPQKVAISVSYGGG